MLIEQASMLASVHQHLLRAQQWMKHQADKRRSKRTFVVDDSVYLKLEPYVQSSLTPRAHQKLSFKYFRPFNIISKIGLIVYKLELSLSSSVHPVFHVSLLKSAPSAKYLISKPNLILMMTSKSLKLFSRAPYVSAPAGISGSGLGQVAWHGCRPCYLAGC